MGVTAADGSIASRLARVEAMLAAGSDEKMGDLEAMRVVLGCLSDEQFRVVALAVVRDERFELVGT